MRHRRLKGFLNAPRGGGIIGASIPECQRLNGAMQLTGEIC